MSWDIPTGEKCPDCASPLVKTARGNVKCSNKECGYKIKNTSPKSDTKKTFIPASEDFDAPPLMDEPIYD